MRIATVKETAPNERRVALVPEAIGKLTGAGHEVLIQTGAGDGASVPDADFTAAGAKVVSEEQLYADADVVLRVQKPTPEEVGKLRKGQVVLGLLQPLIDPQNAQALAAAGVTAVSLDTLPRTLSRAQTMDALSSQANVGGYKAVVMAADAYGRYFPLLTTAAGTAKPANVLILGVGVAGLQAIATAKRLGARVEAFDTRPVVEEQVKSLGAKFVKIDLGEMGQTEQGYAKELTPEQLELQRKGMAKVCSDSDVVITTAKLFGRPAPLLLTKDMLKGMAPGSVIIDLAASPTGGNVEGSKPGETIITEEGVQIIGCDTIENHSAQDASLMFASNLVNFIEHFWDEETKTIKLNREDEIIAGCLMTHEGAIVHEKFANA